jgi:CheY-like chemotaxis protein
VRGVVPRRARAYLSNKTRSAAPATFPGWPCGKNRERVFSGSHYFQEAGAGPYWWDDFGQGIMFKAILIVEDDPDEAALLRRCVMSLHSKSPVRVVLRGRDLTDYVEGNGCYADRKAFPYPALIFLDLRMPEMNGFELLEWLKSQPRHAEIPVIVISSFDRQREIRKSYQLGARTFLSKPVKPESIRGAIRALNLPIAFWK